MKPEGDKSFEVTQINDLVDRFTNPVLWVVTSSAGQSRGGLIATFVSKASLVPSMPRFVVGIANHHATWRLIEDSKSFALHIVGQDQAEWVARFGLQSSANGIDKFSGIPTRTAMTGAPILSQALLWMDCRVETSLNTGDRTLYVAEVVTSGSQPHGEPARLQEIMPRLTAEQRAEARQQLDHDIQIDAAAIQAWRAVTDKFKPA